MKKATGADAFQGVGMGVMACVAILVATVLTPLLSNIMKDEPEDVKKK